MLHILDLGISFLNLVVHLHHFLRPNPESLSKSAPPLLRPGSRLVLGFLPILRCVSPKLHSAAPNIPAKRLIFHQETPNIEPTSSYPKPFWNSYRFCASARLKREDRNSYLSYNSAKDDRTKQCLRPHENPQLRTARYLLIR